MTEQNAQDLLDAIALALNVQRDDHGAPGIPLGDGPADQAPHLDRIDYREGDGQVWLRLTNGEAWLLRAYRLGDNIRQEPEVAVAQTTASYLRYKGLLNRWVAVAQTAKAAGIEDSEQLLQAYYDDVLDDDQRKDWDRWSPAGYATAQEWATVAHMAD